MNWVHSERRGEGLAVGHVDAPLWHQAALALVVGKDGFGDVEHAHVLEHPGVGAVGQEAQPGLDVQVVAGQVIGFGGKSHQRMKKCQMPQAHGTNPATMQAR